MDTKLNQNSEKFSVVKASVFTGFGLSVKKSVETCVRLKHSKITLEPWCEDKAIIILLKLLRDCDFKYINQYQHRTLQQ